MSTDNLDIELQIASTALDIPDKETLELWVNHVMMDRKLESAAMTIRVVDEPESQDLNHNYRNKVYPTNVLSFAFELPVGIPQDEFEGQLGDIVVCAPVVATEAQEQKKVIQHHWAHLIIHGTLHLLGYDHINPEEADKMELIETRILCKLDITDPYKIL